MNPLSLPRLALLAATSLPTALLAQRFDNTAIPMEFLETSPWTVSAGARLSTEGARVNFGQLGVVNNPRSAPPAGAGAVDRFYDDGSVLRDAARANEKDAAGNVFTTPGQRYQGRTVDSAGNEIYIGDFVAYSPDRARSWSVSSASQVADGVANMHLYSTTSSGATAESEKTMSGGFEVSASRRLWRFGRRVEVGITGLFGLNDINAGTTGAVAADLVTITDRYRLYGDAPTKYPHAAPTFNDWTAPNGAVYQSARETSNPVDQLPFERQLLTAANGATINGSWKINGAYYIVRVGPIVRVFITDRLAVSFEAGLASAFVGTDYEVRETLELANLTTPITVTEEEEETALLTGFYGSGAVEYWMTDRTNAYAGAAYESLDNYQQSVGGRTADIDIGSTVTVRLGLTTRF